MDRLDEDDPLPLEKQYDQAEVLERATRAFWAQGYAATSVGDLVATTGIGRGSLYAAFDGKRGLFLACLKHYDARHREDFLDEIAAGHAPREAILAAFEAAARPGAGRPSGCLLVNTALELSPHDPEVREVVNASLTSVERFFLDRLRVAQAEGNVPSGRDPVETAKILLGLFVGLRVLVRSGLDRTAVSAVIRQAEALLTESAADNQGGKP